LVARTRLLIQWQNRKDTLILPLPDEKPQKAVTGLTVTAFFVEIRGNLSNAGEPMAVGRN
jgi:hypothetical protein